MPETEKLNWEELVTTVVALLEIVPARSATTDKRSRWSLCEPTIVDPESVY